MEQHDDFIRRRDAITALTGADIRVKSWRIGQCILSEYFKSCKEGFIDIVRNCPGVDVIEVRHGAWETIKTNSNKGVVRRCSCCLKERVNAAKSAYCRDCGAKMDLPDRDLRRNPVPPMKLGPYDLFDDRDYSGLLDE